MMTIYEIKEIAKKHISSVCNNELALTGKLIEFEEGVLFYYNAKKYIETKDFRFLPIGGLMAFIVDKEDGTIFMGNVEKSFNQTKALIRLFQIEKNKNFQRQKWTDHKFHLDLPVGWTRNVLARVEGSEIRLAHYCKNISDEIASFQPNGKYSIKEHIGHLSDLEELWTARIKNFGARKNTLMTWDVTNQKTTEANHNDKSIEELLNEFSEKRKILLHEFSLLSNDDLHFESMHPRLHILMKPIDLMYFIGEHDDHHISFIIEIKENFQ